MMTTGQQGEVHQMDDTIVTDEDAEVLAEPWNIPARTLRLSIDPADALVEVPPCIERDSTHMLTNEHH